MPLACALRAQIGSGRRHPPASLDEGVSEPLAGPAWYRSLCRPLPSRRLPDVPKSGSDSVGYSPRIPERRRNPSDQTGRAPQRAAIRRGRGFVRSPPNHCWRVGILPRGAAIHHHRTRFRDTSVSLQVFAGTQNDIAFRFHATGRLTCLPPGKSITRRHRGQRGGAQPGQRRIPRPVRLAQPRLRLAARSFVPIPQRCF
jgi:hypothetical protein